MTPHPDRDQDNDKPLEFSVRQKVVLRSDPSVTVMIVEVIPGEPEDRYVVFQQAEERTYYASQLQALPAQEEQRAIVSSAAFTATLSALFLTQPGLTSLYSLQAARITFVPHQFRPVLKFIRSDRPRLLVADEVGVGKTIEAGLILRELQARKDVRSVLVLCPKPLVTERKWYLELKRFDEEFEHLDGPTLRQCIEETDLDGEWPARYAKAIVPFSLLDAMLLYGKDAQRKRRKKHTSGLMSLDPPPHFDLVIVDEAHHIRNTNTMVHQGVRFFCEHAEAVVFLTATPIQMGSNDLFVLLNMLRPDLILDKASFQSMAEPNPHINQAIERARGAVNNWQTESLEALQHAAETPWGSVILRPNPIFQRVQEHLKQGTLSPEARIQCIRDMEQVHTFDSLINRTRRRDIGEFTTRKPETVTVAFTPQQQTLHDELLDVLSQMIAQTHGNINVKFLTSTIRRRAASCLFGLAPFLDEMLQRKMSSLYNDIDNDTDGEPDWDVLNGLSEQVQHVLELLEDLDPSDPKIEALQQIIQDKQQMPNNKLLIFTSFKHTLTYILEHIGTGTNANVRFAAVHGGTPDEERRNLRHRFSLPRDDTQALDVLVSTEVGCEGLDYQFCDCLVNYDIPWNPMRVEQRIGRIDRYGQKSEAVAIYNLVTPDTIDFDIYDRCLLRIGIFNHVVGGSEEILGEITRELREVAENLSLTKQERERKLQQLADNEILLLQEQQKLEAEQENLFGITIPMQQATQDEITEATNYWLQPAQLINLIEHYVQQRCGVGDYLLGEKARKTLRLSQECRQSLLEDYQQLPRQKSPVARAWEKWLKGSEYLLSITFDADYAAEDRNVVFITPVHPLAQQAARLLTTSQPVYTVVCVEDEHIAAGAYPFAIYQWQKQGIRPDMVLQPVCQDPDVTTQCMRLLAKGQPLPSDEPYELPAQDVFDALESHHYQLWAQERDAYHDETRRLGAYRRESLNRSHQAHHSVLQDRLAQVTDERIRRLYERQIANAAVDVERRLAELDAAVSRADIVAQRVAFGVILVENNREIK